MRMCTKTHVDTLPDATSWMVRLDCRSTSLGNFSDTTEDRPTVRRAYTPRICPPSAGDVGNL